MTQIINNYKLFGYDEIFVKFKAMENIKILPNKICLLYTSPSPRDS